MVVRRETDPVYLGSYEKISQNDFESDRTGTISTGEGEQSLEVSRRSGTTCWKKRHSGHW